MTDMNIDSAWVWIGAESYNLQGLLADLLEADKEQKLAILDLVDRVKALEGGKT